MEQRILSPRFRREIFGTAFMIHESMKTLRDFASDAQQGHILADLMRHNTFMATRDANGAPRMVDFTITPDTIIGLADAIEALPVEEDAQSVAYLHYIMGKSHFYVTHKGDGTNIAPARQFIGSVEMPSTSVEVLINNGAELDVSFKPTAFYSNEVHKLA